MAEQEKSKTFKYGDREYLIDDLLKLHAQQENNFYQFAKERGHYDDEALQGLREAIKNRVQSVRDSKQFTGDGLLDTDTADNIEIATQEGRGWRKKTKYVKQDNTEGAKHYLNTLVNNLTPISEKTTSKGSWNIDKYGFAAYLSGQGLNAKEIFENYDKYDENNPEAKRKYDQRRQLLKEHLINYNNWLQTKGFDFTKNDNEWDDNFINDLSNLINNFDNFDNNQLMSNLRRIGSGDGFTTAFTSDKFDLTQSDKQSDKQNKEEKEYQEYLRGIHNTFKNSPNINLGNTTYFTTTGDGLFEMSDDEYEKWKSDTKTKDGNTYMNNLQQSYYSNPFDTKTAAEYLPLAHRFGALNEVTIDGKSYLYDPKTIDYSNNRFVAFDPKTGEIRHAFIGNIENEKANLRRKWRIDNGYEEEVSQYFKEGGIVSMQTGGGFNLAQAVNREMEETNKQKAKETGHSEKVQKTRDRVVSNGDDSFAGVINSANGEQPSIAQSNPGFTGAERARLISIGADITSLFLDPLSGTAVGIGSSLTNFGADVADDGFQWSDVGNLGISLGLDLLGAIPIFGDAVGTGTKITRNLLKFAPRILAGLAGLQGVSNLGGMTESWQKLTSGDKDQKLTVQDWRNIAQSISLVTGAGRAIKNKAAQNTMKREAKVEGALTVNIKNKNSGEVKQILVDGDIAKKLKDANGDASKIKEELNKFDSYKNQFNDDWEVNTQIPRGLQKPWERVQNADGSKSTSFRSPMKQGRAEINDYYDFNQTKGYSGWGFGGSEKIRNFHKNVMEPLNRNKNLVDLRKKQELLALPPHVLTNRDTNSFGSPTKTSDTNSSVVPVNSASKIDMLPNNIQELLTLPQNTLTSQHDNLKAGLTPYLERVRQAQSRKQKLDNQSDKQKSAIQKQQEIVNQLNKQIEQNNKALSTSKMRDHFALDKKLNSKDKNYQSDVEKLFVEKENQTFPSEWKKEIKQTEVKINTLTKKLRKIDKQLNSKNVTNKKQLLKQRNKIQSQLDTINDGRYQSAVEIYQRYNADQLVRQQLQQLQQLKRAENKLRTLKAQEFLTQKRLDKGSAELRQLKQHLSTLPTEINGTKIDWNIENILRDAQLVNAWKQGGSINLTKINKFLKYAKG